MTACHVVVLFDPLLCRFKMDLHIHDLLWWGSSLSVLFIFILSCSSCWSTGWIGLSLSVIFCVFFWWLIIERALFSVPLVLQFCQCRAQTHQSAWTVIFLDSSVLSVVLSPAALAKHEQKALCLELFFISSWMIDGCPDPLCLAAFALHQYLSDTLTSSA